MGQRVAFLSHEVLLLLPSSEGLSFDDSLNFPFRGVFNDIRRGLEEVWAMFRSFLVRGKEQGMEYVVDLPCFR